MKGKERSVRTGRGKTDGLSISRKALEPGTWCLFKTIKRFLKKTNMIRIGGMFEAKRLLTIDCFLKRAMKKSIFDI